MERSANMETDLSDDRSQGGGAGDGSREPPAHEKVNDKKSDVIDA